MENNNFGENLKFLLAMQVIDDGIKEIRENRIQIYFILINEVLNEKESNILEFGFKQHNRWYL